MFVYTPSDIIAVIFFGFLFIFWLILWVPYAVKQWRCKHDEGVNETRACDAICRKCGKNLGFIGNWRK